MTSYTAHRATKTIPCNKILHKKQKRSTGKIRGLSNITAKKGNYHAGKIFKTN